ncbi:MAG: alpha-amylase/4-alpha-glucanotransferase domain-containing protein, partial [Thermodesulfobacteriota bacterium]
MDKVYFLFCVHNHQPVGNFHHVLEEAYQKAYRPFIEILKEYPFMRITLHYSGVLWDFFIKHHPEFLETLRGLFKKGQLEMMTGGYYEPILAVIPDEDKVGQIEMLNQIIKKETGVSPRGLWLAERIWEPHLPKFLVKAGVEYITIDDYHFKKAGLKEEDLNGYYLTEDEGKVVKVFPGSEKLRYIIPFHPPEETLEYLSSLRGGDRAAIFADDGEKFGIWPYTYHSVYEESWLVRFFQMIGENLNWIEPTPLGTYASQHKPLGRIYLPCSSYMEMDEWSLPTEAMVEYGKVVERLKTMPEGEQIRRFLKGGFWRNFFAKYPESNDLHKRVLSLSEKIKDKVRKKAFSILKSKEATTYLYRAECNDGYWHGVFGGLYLPHLRHALYENLIKAETLYDKLRYTRKEWLEVERVDLNGDGEEEVLLKNPKVILLFSCLGGSLLEMDDRPKAFNILNTIARRKEGYHQKLLEVREKNSDGTLRTIHEIFDSKESNLDQYLHFDSYRKASFLDHFLSKEVTLDSFRKGDFEEIGDFIKNPYHLHITTLSKRKEVIFSRSGQLSLSGESIPIDLEKRYTIFNHRSVIEASYQIVSSRGERPLDCLFGIEFNINLLAGDAIDRYYEIPGHPLEDRRLRSVGQLISVSKVSLIDEYNGIK